MGAVRKVAGYLGLSGIDHYDEGGRPNPHLDANMQPLQLSDGEKRDLLAFLQSLTGTLRQ